MAKAKTNEMPHTLEAEQALLGCLLIDNDIQLEILSELAENDFYAESHKYILEAMKEINKQNMPVDLVTLTDQLEKTAQLSSIGGISYLTDLTEIMPSTANYRHYFDIVKRDSVLRKLIKASTEIIKDATDSQNQDESLAFAEKSIYDIAESVDASSVQRINEVLPTVISKFDKISKDKNAFKGLSTKFTSLDYITNGLQPSDLVLIAARPSMGKTSFAMNIVENVAINSDKVCMVFSLEMSREQLVQRMICSVAGVNSKKALRGELQKEDWIKFVDAESRLSKAKIYIDDSSMITPTEMLSKCRRLKNKVGLDLIMIDYIQLMNGSGKKGVDNRQQEIAEISRMLKIMAKEINVPVVALSQLSRSVESRQGHRPQLSDLRESGAIEQDADIVMFIHRPDRSATKEEIEKNQIKPNVAEIIVAKHRNGEVGSFELYFKGECTKFVNLSKDEEPAFSKPKTNYEEYQNAPVNNEPMPTDDDVPPEDDGLEY
ncbi:MAG: replicative DNA helicase [Clostridiales bacterium]|nr:replicative DNA helicase [Clostridiales bacterium]